jgi:tetratricopeptide (TPR) repeat protein
MEVNVGNAAEGARTLADRRAWLASGKFPPLHFVLRRSFMPRPLFPVLCLSFSLAASAAPKRPAVDLQAMREAMGTSSDGPDFPEKFSSAASYAHFLRSRLLHLAGDHKGALDELRLALASDDGNPFLLTAMAEQYARLSELDRAEATIKKVLDKAPDYAPAQLLMGRVLYEANKLTRARAHLLRATRLDPKEPEAYLVLTQLWLDQNKPDEAVNVVEQLASALPGEPVGYRRLGLALVERGDPARAEALLLKAVERDPGDFDSWVALAQLYEGSNRLEAAEEAFVRALLRDPDNRAVLLALGRLSLRVDKPEQAKAYFDQLLSLSKDPEQAVKVSFSYLAMRKLNLAVEVLDGARKQPGAEPRLNFYAGLVYERMRSWQKAAEAFAAVARDVGDLFHEARLHRAMCLSNLGQHARALELLRKGLEERADYDALVPALGRALERAGQGKEAEALMLKALVERPASETVEALASLYERQGRVGEAVAVLNQALVRHPRDELLLYALAALYEKKGEVQKSLDKMRAVLELNPENANAMNFIGYTLADKSLDLDEAERLLGKALELRPDSGAFLDSLGWLYFRRGDFGRAVSTLEKATALAPGESTIEEHLGDAYVKSTRRSEAADAYRRALEALKDSAELADAKAQRAAVERKLKAVTTELGQR